ncbi:MAG: 2-C-methyl-D-erythritol 4-phosphate cytidylyltransferase [Burkholderiaceae bacterium]|nr:2-C-methyl-D-erythritol 4-phosphate cytidylyltransferase [Gemmatimonadales bacterium]MCO5119862.1 2-C-methyl-D-erythritol 4-phosphate cytidylyltransferase [Burkholderiaceae bacterium]MEB2319820.1 2-C-methyl-D-erythritol 4-phosphate cytidylyltransferase [Pseudomonadota bacterium]
MPERIHAIMPAAGQGQRLGADLPKQYLPLVDAPMIVHSVRALLAAQWVDELVVVVAPGDAGRAGTLLAGWPRVRVRAIGGASRRDSVLAGIESLDAPDDDWVLVHDAARPGLPLAALDALRDVAIDDPVGGLLALPVADTIKREDGASPARSAGTVDRARLWLAQTPQMFRLGMLRDALHACPDATDEAAAMEAAGHRPRLVAGHRDNFKVTSAGDLAAMAAVLRARGGNRRAGEQ